MTPQQALAHYQSQAEIARVLGCKQSSVSEWFKEGAQLPDGRQYQLQLASDGALKADKPADRRAAAAASAIPVQERSTA